MTKRFKVKGKEDFRLICQNFLNDRNKFPQFLVFSDKKNELIVAVNDSLDNDFFWADKVWNRIKLIFKEILLEGGEKNG